MKTSIFERILILLAFNIYKITTICFAISLILAVISYSFFNQVPLVISYIFWFNLGTWGFSLVIRRAIFFLEKKHEDKNKYYLELLAKK